MDSLNYRYINSGHKPFRIDDSRYQTFDPNLKHFVDRANENDEYKYDASGRTLKAKNRNVNFYYNQLGLPRHIVNGGYKIEYTYDAAGNKLQKHTSDPPCEPDVLCDNSPETFDYIGNFVYQNGEQKMIYHPEGVIRPTPSNADNETDYVYDYFIKDYLGNVRVVLTEEDATYTDKFLATMEDVYRQIEEDNFDNINETAESLPTGYPLDGSVGFNAKIAALSQANGTEMGPSMVLPVRKGDKVSLSTKYFYTENADGQTYDNVDLFVNEILMALATSGAGVLRLNEAQLLDIAAGNSQYANAIMNLLSSNFDPNNVTKPHAYLVWMLYDNNMNLIPEGSGVKQVERPNELGALLKDEIPIVKSGYLHAYVSNGSATSVAFDNFMVTYLRGQTRQINHYYPYGLSISGLGGNYDEYKNKYTSKELQTGDLDPNSSTGLEMFDFHARFYDPQLGRWFVPDPAEQFHNPYLAMANNPVRYTDPSGMYTGIDEISEDGGGGYKDPDPGNGIELGWDGNYHGAGGNTDAYRFSNFSPSSSHRLGEHSWLNSFGAHNGSFAPFTANGHVNYYNSERGEMGYEKHLGYFESETFYNRSLQEDGSLIFESVELGSFVTGTEWVSLGEGGGDFSNSNFVLTLGGILYGIGEHAVAGKDYWLGIDGKYYFNMTGRGPNQWTGSRIGALKVSRVFKMAGRATFFLGALISGYEGVGQFRSGNYLGASKSGLDITMGAISTYGGVPGLVIGTTYFATDAVMSVYTNRLNSNPSFLRSEFSRAIGNDPRFGGIK